MDHPGGHSGFRAASAVVERVAVGDYLCSEHELFHVEQLGGERAVIEDCRSGDLLDVPLDELTALRRVGPS